MRIRAMIVVFAATAVQYSWSPCLGAESHPASSYGDFSAPENAMKAAGYSYYQGVSTCAEGKEFDAECEWYDFSPMLAPMIPVGSRFLYLCVDWKLSYTAGKGVISIGIDYSTNNGTTWRTLMADTYSSGLGTLPLQRSTTILRKGFPPGLVLRNLVVRAWIKVEEACPGTIGSYGGTFYIKQIRVIAKKP